MADQFEHLKAALADRYAIEREVGSGGMATVYLAEDLKHHRKVAVKVLRPELAAILGAERFLKEIEVTANLQHPHILPLFDSGEVDSFLYYVMPYVEGESLRQKLNRERQLAVEDALHITEQVAAALDHAHGHEIVHRDIKPENILLEAGQAVVADFGIALAVTAAGGTRLTETGLSLGTPQYMSPEQATADRVLDARSDVYSLACVLYEMLVGETPHTGPTVQAIIARVLSDTPTPIRQTRDLTPANVEAAVQKALAKSPGDRFASAALFAEALTNPTFMLPTTGTTAEVQAGRAWNRFSIAATGVAVVMTVAALWGWLRPEPAQPVIRYSLGLAEEEALRPDYGTSIALSPDGSRLVYVGSAEGGSSALWVKERDQLRPRQIPGTDDASFPFFAPDGERVGFFTLGPRALKVVSLADGGLITVADAPFTERGGSWSPDGDLYLTGAERSLIRLSESGAQEPVTELAPGEIGHVLPDLLPSGRGVLFTVWHERRNNWAGADIAVVDLATGHHEVLAGGALARYAKTGHLVFVRGDGTLLAAPFDEERLTLTGPPVALFEGVTVSMIAPSGVDLALASNGTLVYATREGIGPARELVWVERDGTYQLIDPDWTGLFESVALSPDGTRLAVTIGSVAETDIWIKQLDRGPPSLLTFTDGLNRRPTWTTDGLSVTFISNRGGNRDLYVKRADGVGSAEPVLDLAITVDEGFWSPDGDWLIYRAGMEGEERDIFAWRPGPDSATVTVAAAPGVSELSPALSPDGRWLAYMSYETGRWEVWVRPFPNVEAGRWQVSVEGGTEPVWAHSGRELFYKSQGSLKVVSVQTSPTFATLEARGLFSTQSYFHSANHSAYDVTRDDRRFVMIRNPEAESNELIVVENFFEELKAKVGN